MCIEDCNAWCGTSYTQILCVISFLPLLNHSILLLKMRFHILFCWFEDAIFWKKFLHSFAVHIVFAWQLFVVHLFKVFLVYGQ